MVSSEGVGTDERSSRMNVKSARRKRSFRAFVVHDHSRASLVMVVVTGCADLMPSFGILLSAVFTFVAGSFGFFRVPNIVPDSTT